MAGDTYERKLGSDEAARKYIFITKEALEFFPRAGDEFKIRAGGSEFAARVVAVECACMGPDKPHEHYNIDASNFKDKVAWKRGTLIKIKKVSEREYELV